MLLRLALLLLLVLGAIVTYEAAHQCHIGKGGLLCKLWKATA
jgi:hypothetical protein